MADRMKYGFTEHVKSLGVLVNPALLYNKQAGVVAKSAFCKLHICFVNSLLGLSNLWFCNHMSSLL